MSVTIKCTDIVKRFGDNTVIPGLNLEIKESEFFTLLGPSGCGKTTLLRMVAGFNSIEGGTISFNDKVINQIAPNKRNIGMVFQNYAIFPHMSVIKNVAYGLTTRNVSKAQTERRENHVLDKLTITPLRDRMPEHMSGGQQQRIALARAMVIEPDVLLMDEPLSNLDAKLRLEMREVIRDLQKSVGITTIYVTHDQEEAMAVSDRIAVMKDGVIQQIGTPRSIYHRPMNIFVANFIGSTNIISAVAGGRTVTVDGYRAEIPALASPLPEGTAVKLSVRPEELLLAGPDVPGIKGTVKSSTFLGNMTHYLVMLDAGDEIKIIQESSETDYLSPGDRVNLTINTDKVNVFSEDGAKNLTRGE
ncbi:MAG: ABC transporter ATP-binding protein [Clostridia bacterium]|nr:ABC transporter ATP-binding protein [Clostridia bacterium]